MKPKLIEGWTCPVCKTKDTVALETPEHSASLIWCSYGHLTVYDFTKCKEYKMVFDFSA